MFFIKVTTVNYTTDRREPCKRGSLIINARFIVKVENSEDSNEKTAKVYLENGEVIKILGNIDLGGLSMYKNVAKDIQIKN